MQLVGRSALGEQGLRDHDYTYAAVGDAGVDLAPGAGAGARVGVVVPDVEALARRAWVSARTTASLSSVAWEMKTSQSLLAWAGPRHVISVVFGRYPAASDGSVEWV